MAGSISGAALNQDSRGLLVTRVLWPSLAIRSEFSSFRFIGYGGSKAALNMLTVQLAAELRDTGIKVNSADPGYTATDLNPHRGRQSIAEGAAAVVRLALLPNDGPTRGSFGAADSITCSAGACWLPERNYPHLIGDRRQSAALPPLPFADRAAGLFTTPQFRYSESTIPYTGTSAEKSLLTIRARTI
jgi:NAD(P)-dependent dehydrogenase (short-subunit alcohol dehydrogenase family)